VRTHCGNGGSRAVAVRKVEPKIAAIPEAYYVEVQEGLQVVPLRTVPDLALSVLFE
jgi:hypothetical protein